MVLIHHVSSTPGGLVTFGLVKPHSASMGSLSLSRGSRCPERTSLQTTRRPTKEILLQPLPLLVQEPSMAPPLPRGLSAPPGLEFQGCQDAPTPPSPVLFPTVSLMGHQAVWDPTLGAGECSVRLGWG